MVRDGLKSYLAAETDIEVVGEASDASEAVDQARLLRPDVVVMDLAMPGGGGLAATSAIRVDLPATQVVILTSAIEDHVVAEALKAGATGFILKEAGGQDLVAAIRAAADGRVHVSPEAAARLARAVADGAGPDALTAREREVISLLAGGMTNREIAGRLGVSDKTVKGHVTNILQKLHLATRTQAALYAVRTGLTAPTTPT